MRSWIKLALLAALAAVAAFLLAPDPDPHGAGVGAAAPPVALPDLAGRQVSLADLRGKVVALNFWATWCPPCKEEMPALVESWHALPRGCAEFVGVTEESTREDAAAFAAASAVPYPILLDGDGSVARAYGVDGLPRTYVIDASGVIRRVFIGRVSRKALDEAIAPLLPAGCKEKG